MSTVLVDANVILDIATLDPTWCKWCAEALERCASTGLLVINPVVFAEVSAGYTRIETVNEKLPETYYKREDIPYSAAFLAGKAFIRYRRQGGTKSSTLPEFFIGAHAAVRKYKLLTRDPRRYRTYFPSVELVAPK